MTLSKGYLNNGLNETHDPNLRSWVTGANDLQGDFPVQNLPYSIFRRTDGEAWRIGVAIGDQVLDLAALDAANILDGEAAVACHTGVNESLNKLMALGGTYWSALRLALSRLLRTGAPHIDVTSNCLVPMAQATFRMPVAVGDYTDFYTSLYHARNGGRMKRPNAPLTPNYVWVPIGYHGRASSIVVSGEQVFRPQGQLGLGQDDRPRFGLCEKLDFELELAVYVGVGNDRGTSIPIDAAEQHIFGVSLLNDWSARDIQFWENQPLGPFLAKNFVSTVSPWVVTWEALLPFRGSALRPAGSQQPLPYLYSEQDAQRGALDIQLRASFHSQQMQQLGLAPKVLTETNSRYAYWTISQLVAHHTVNGCNLQSGDMLGTGTLSGPEDGSLGCLFEITQDGNEPLSIPDGEERTYLRDFDSIVIEGRCESEGCAPIGFGACSGTVLPSVGGVEDSFI